MLPFKTLKTAIEYTKLTQKTLAVDYNKRSIFGRPKPGRKRKKKAPRPPKSNIISPIFTARYGEVSGASKTTF